MACACCGPTAGTVTLTGTVSRTAAGHPVSAASSAQASQRAHSRGPYSANGENSPGPAGPVISAPSRTVMPRKRVRHGNGERPRGGQQARPVTSGPAHQSGSVGRVAHCSPSDRRLMCRINLTTVTSRPLHAVLLPPRRGGGRFLELLSAALDGSGPAILPLDPGMPPARLRAVLAAFAPTALETPDGTNGSPAATLPAPDRTAAARSRPRGAPAGDSAPTSLSWWPPRDPPALPKGVAAHRRGAAGLGGRRRWPGSAPGLASAGCAACRRSTWRACRSWSGR